MEFEGMKDASPAELMAYIDNVQAKVKEDLERVKSDKKDIKPLLDALKLVGKCRRSKGGGVCDPCWSAVTKELDALGLHIWGL